MWQGHGTVQLRSYGGSNKPTQSDFLVGSLNMKLRAASEATPANHIFFCKKNAQTSSASITNHEIATQNVNKHLVLPPSWTPQNHSTHHLSQLRVSALERTSFSTKSNPWRTGSSNEHGIQTLVQEMGLHAKDCRRITAIAQSRDQTRTTRSDNGPKLFGAQDRKCMLRKTTVLTSENIIPTTTATRTFRPAHQSFLFSAVATREQSDTWEGLHLPRFAFKDGGKPCQRRQRSDLQG